MFCVFFFNESWSASAGEYTMMTSLSFECGTQACVGSNSRLLALASTVSPSRQIAWRSLEGEHCRRQTASRYRLVRCVGLQRAWKMLHDDDVTWFKLSCEYCVDSSTGTMSRQITW